MKKYLLFFIHTLVICLGAQAQYNSPENRIWAFGNRAGLDFSSGAPVPFTSFMNTDEGNATLCDSAGNLVFCTNGKTIWNKVGDTMPNAAAIVSFSTSSTSQAAVIVPYIGQPGKYFVFSLQEIATLNDRKLAYCIVDMSLDGGLGDVVVSTRETLLDSAVSEKMIAIPGNNDNFWLVTHRVDTNLFVVYNINASGIGSKIFTKIGEFHVGGLCTHGYAIGGIKSSPDRSMIALAEVRVGTCKTGGVELYDFDPATGAITNCRVLDTSGSFSYGEFSPDNRKLYMYRVQPTSELRQFDLSLPTTDDIIASRYVVTASVNVMSTDLKLGPDARIYFRSMNSTTAATTLDCISNPNGAGSTCGLTTHCIDLSPNPSRGCFPNLTYNSRAASSVKKQQTLSAYSVYPNPAQDELKLTGAELFSSATITDIAGVNVYSYQGRKGITSIDISRLPAGVYFARLNDYEPVKFIKK